MFTNYLNPPWCTKFEYNSSNLIDPFNLELLEESDNKNNVSSFNKYEF